MDLVFSVALFTQGVALLESIERTINRVLLIFIINIIKYELLILHFII